MKYIYIPSIDPGLAMWRGFGPRFARLKRVTTYNSPSSLQLSLKSCHPPFLRFLKMLTSSWNHYWGWRKTGGKRKRLWFWYVIVLLIWTVKLNSIQCHVMGLIGMATITSNEVNVPPHLRMQLSWILDNLAPRYEQFGSGPNGAYLSAIHHVNESLVNAFLLA